MNRVHVPRKGMGEEEDQKEKKVGAGGSRNRLSLKMP